MPHELNQGVQTAATGYCETQETGRVGGFGFGALSTLLGAGQAKTGGRIQGFYAPPASICQMSRR